MKVIIADDESLPRAYLKNLIEDLDLSANIVGEAQNGFELVDLVKAHKPDIAFVDVKMPGMNGLEAIEALKDTGIQTQWVILSGFSEFEYAKEAIKLGVTDYLLKPVSIDEMSSIFSSLVKRNKELAITFNKEFESELTALFYEIGGYSCYEDTGYPNNTFFCGAIFIFDSSLDEKQKTRSQFEFTSRIREILQEYMDIHSRFALFVLPSGNPSLVGACIPAANRAVRENIMKCLNTISHISNEFNNGNFFITTLLTDECKSFDMLHSCFNQLQNLAALRVLCQNSVLTIDRLASLYKQYPRQLLEISNDLINLSNAYSGKEYVKYMKIADDFGKNFQTAMVSKDKNTAKSIQGFIFHTLNLKIDLNGKSSMNVKILKDKGQSILDELQRQEYSSADIISNTIKYIEQNYMYDISVNSISEQLNITASYLSSLFHKKTGTTFIKYLTRIRMLKSKELLSNPNSQVQQVAESVGYFSTRHFRKLFMEYYGCPPSVYRRDVLTEALNMARQYM